jgi:single stranded DNA-binding protein
MTQTAQKKTLTTKPKRIYHNEVVFTGRLGGDPEMSFVGSGKAITKFSLAVNQGKDKTMWLNIVCWEELAEGVNESAAKGSLVTVTGRLSQRKWEGRYYHDVVANRVEIEDDERATTTKTTAASDFVNEEDGLGELDDHPF